MCRLKHLFIEFMIKRFIDKQIDIHFVNPTKNLCEELFNPEKEILIYHFTNATAASQILSSKKMWFKDYKYLKDQNEIKYAFEVFIEVIKEVVFMAEDKIFWEHFLKVFQDMTLLKNNTYISCYCLHYHNKYLWEEYGDHERGYALGFHKKILRSNDKNYNFFLADIAKVYYSDKAAYNNAKKLIKFADSTYNIVKDSKRLKSEYDVNYFFKNLRLLLHGSLISLMPIFKNKSYSPEEEVRLCIHKISDLDLFDNMLAERVIKCNGSIVGVIDDFNVHELVEIIIGPKADYEKEKKKIEKLLLDSGYDLNKIKILPAKISQSQASQ